MLLVFDPFEKVEKHIILLGFEMIIRALKLTFYSDKEIENLSVNNF